jgi:hypothetical protein
MGAEANGARLMADERKDKDKIEPAVREAGAASPPEAGGLERYPDVDRTDAVQPSVEQRSFDPSADAPTPCEGVADASTQAGRLGPQGDPAEGRRE